MQRKIKNAYIYRQNKIEGLMSYWDKILGKLGQAASKKNDEATKNLVFKKLMNVNKDIKRTILEKYLKKCCELHSIAFLQWRAMYPNQYVDQDILQELIQARIMNFINGLVLKNKPKAKTRDQGKIADISKFYKQYKSVFEQQPPVSGTKSKVKQVDQAFLINKMWDIGWADPFPDKECGGAPQGMKDMKLPLEPKDLAYARQRYIEGNSPSVVYIPKKAIMFKLVRACLACQEEEDLWYSSKEKAKDADKEGEKGEDQKQE